MHDHPRRVDAMAAEVLSWEAVVSHQLKTPLCAMQAELARAREVDRSRILHDVQRLIRLIDQLHLAGLCRSRRIRMRPAPLAAAATQVCTRLAPLALDRGQTLALRRFGPDPLVMIDRALAEEAICNLVENAIKYAPEGSRVDVCVTDRGKVHVLDEGPGLTEADRARVFEPFRRGAGAAGLPGSGLGLSLAAMIMSMHKGDVVQVNRPRGGSVFTLRFRKPKEAASSMRRPPRPGAGEPAGGSGAPDASRAARSGPPDPSPPPLRARRGVPGRPDPGHPRDGGLGADRGWERGACAAGRPLGWRRPSPEADHDVPAEAGSREGDGGGLPAARDRGRDGVRADGEVLRDRAARREKAEGAGGRGVPS